MTMEDWSKRLDLFMMADDREVLQDTRKITAEIAKAKAETEFEKYRVVQDRLFMSDFDKYMLELEDRDKLFDDTLRLIEIRRGSVFVRKE